MRYAVGSPSGLFITTSMRTPGRMPRSSIRRRSTPSLVRPTTVAAASAVTSSSVMKASWSLRSRYRVLNPSGRNPASGRGDENPGRGAAGDADLVVADAHHQRPVEWLLFDQRDRRARQQAALLEV